MRRCRLTILVAAAGFVAIASATAAVASDLAGTYTDQNGITQLVFKNDRVTITRLGIMQGIFKYTVNGKEITVSGANSGQAMLLEIDDKGCLVGVPGSGELCKLGGGSSAGAQGVSGVYTGTDPEGGSISFDFHDDGTVEMSAEGMQVNATYTVDGKKVTITAPKSAGGDVMVLQIDDKGCLGDPQDNTELCKSQAAAKPKTSAPNTSGVWGTYTATDPTAGTIRYVFYNDGSVKISTDGATLTATYAVKGKKVTITAPKGAGGDSFDLQFDDKGCLTNPDDPSALKLCKQ